MHGSYNAYPGTEHQPDAGSNEEEWSDDVHRRQGITSGSLSYESPVGNVYGGCQQHPQ